MNRFTVYAAATVLAALWAAPASAQLANGGFEDPITADGAPFVGFWEGFSGAGAAAANSTTSPRTGASSLRLSIDNTNETFGGVFQDVPNLTPGTPVIFSGYHRTPSDPLGLGTEVRIEWRNATSEVARTPNSTPVPTAQYAPFSLTATVPAGANTARVVYAIQSFGPEPTNNGIVFVDDVTFAIVPEPGTAALLGFAGALQMRRRRRA